MVSTNPSQPFTGDGGNIGGLMNNNPSATEICVEEGIAEQMSTTKFLDDADAVCVDESTVVHISRTLTSLNDSQTTEESLKAFLKRPIVISTGAFSTTDTLAAITTYTEPWHMLRMTNSLMWRQKLAGFFGIRMDIRFRIVVNGNPFQQGRYIMGWVPLCGAYKDSTSTKIDSTTNAHIATLVQRTTCNHVEIDISSATSAELLVPFVSVHNFYPLNTILSDNQHAQLGKLYICPYSPLVTPSGSTNASFTVYASYENVELFGAAAAQSGLQDKEVANKQNGPISGPTLAIAKAFKEFGEIPLISSYSNSVSWIADRISKTSAMFGFSKPTQGDSMMKVNLVNAGNHTVIDGDSDARSVSFLSKPGTVKLEGLSGNKYDEMDFSYVGRKYAWFKSQDWTAAAAPGTLTTFDIKPDVTYQTTGSVNHFQPVALLSALFTYWRGSLKYRIKFVKTKFHSGRLEFVFYPTDELSVTGDSTFTNRLIVDIRETAEIEFVVPYISRYPYQGSVDKIGMVSINIVDPLVAPASVSSTVSLLFEIAAGDDFEVAIPRYFNQTPTLITPQSGLNENVERLTTTSIGSTQVNSNPYVFSAVSIGDKVSSFRALLKKFTPLRPTDKATAATNLANTGYLMVRPDAINITNAGTATYTYNSDLLGSIAFCYGIWRGGIRIRNVIDIGMLNQTNTNAQQSNVAVYYLTDQAYGVAQQVYFADTSAGAVSTNHPLVMQNMYQNNTITIEVPQYTTTLGRNTSDIWTSYVVGSNDQGYQAFRTSSNTQGYLMFTIPKNTLASLTPQAGYSVHNLYRAMADDGDLSVFISVPPMKASTFGTQDYAFY